MFSLFGKKKNKFRTVDYVFISGAAKQKGMVNILKQKSSVLIAWFNDSISSAQEIVEKNNLDTEVFMAREVSSHHLRHRPVFFYEHYPLLSRENEILEKLAIPEVIFFSSMDEPLFKHFGGDRIITLMQKMGMNENEVIQHALITTSIKNAQEKIAQKVITDSFANSQEEWFSKNFANT